MDLSGEPACRCAVTSADNVHVGSKGALTASCGVGCAGKGEGNNDGRIVALS